MKKILALILVFSLAAVMLAGCSRSSQEGTAPPREETTPPSEGSRSEQPAPGEAVLLGLGVVSSIAKSVDYSVKDGKETLPMAQVDTVIAAATFDSESKVVDVIIDTAQTRVNYDADLKVTSDRTAKYPTKRERGDNYGMKAVSGIGKEWYEQIDALEEWMKGKTINEIKSLSLTDRGAPDDPELSTLVTITVTDYIAALEKAYQNAVQLQPGAAKLGLGHIVSIAKSTDYSVGADGKETLPRAQVDTIMAAAAFDNAGKVAGVLIDNAQIRVNFDAEGKVTSDRTAEYRTKAELGEAYGMKAVSGIGKEWYEQIASLQEWMIGKTVPEILALEVKKVDDAHPAVPAVPELTSLVTITVEDYLAALEEAYNNAR